MTNAELTLAKLKRSANHIINRMELAAKIIKIRQAKGESSRRATKLLAYYSNKSFNVADQYTFEVTNARYIDAQKKALEDIENLQKMIDQ